MIVDCRTYEIKVGRLGRLLELYARLGYAAQRRHLGPPLGYFTSHIGPLNQLVHLWRYPSLDDRQRRRRALAADGQWQAYLRAAGELDAIAAQENKILTPAPFFETGAEAQAGGA